MSRSRNSAKQFSHEGIGLLPSPAPAVVVDGNVGEQTHTEVTPERIRARAYEIYQSRNGGPGDEASDWIQAERELTGEAE